MYVVLGARAAILTVLTALILGALMSPPISPPPVCDLTLQLVAESSRMVAGFRAVESAEKDPLFHDPFAAVLAGVHRIQEAEAQQKPSLPGSKRRYLVDALSIRTKWIDDQLLASLEVLPGESQDVGYLSELASQPDDAKACQGVAVKPTQVVLMGSGMDTRPWRLSLPPGVAWFEFDLQEVLALKAALLEELSAEVPPCFARLHFNSNPLKSLLTCFKWCNLCGYTPCVLPSGINAQAQDGLLQTHPNLLNKSKANKTSLQAQSWTAISANLTHADWTTNLIQHGFNTSHATVWVLEGFLTYFSREDAGNILLQMADLSPPGSVVLTVCFSEAGVAGGSHAADIASTWRFSLPEDKGSVSTIMGMYGWTVQYAASPAVVGEAMGIRGGEQRSGGADWQTLFIMATKL